MNDRVIPKAGFPLFWAKLFFLVTGGAFSSVLLSASSTITFTNTLD